MRYVFAFLAGVVVALFVRAKLVKKFVPGDTQDLSAKLKDAIKEKTEEVKDNLSFKPEDTMGVVEQA